MPVPKPNVVLVSLDTTRADRLSCYGHFRRTSPHLDSLAAEGVLFTDFFSPHIPTYPGHTTLMSGKDLYAHQITGQSGTPEPAPPTRMLAELLREQGYHTGAADNLGRWFGRGFDHIETYAWDTNKPRDWRKGEAVTAAALKVLRQAAAQDKPFFLFLHFWDPHTPYLPPAPFDRMFYAGDEKDSTNHSMQPVWAFENFRRYFAEWMPGVTDIEFPKAQYDACIAYMDACFAHVLTHLDALGLSANTLVVVTADHGEELDEHGDWFDHHGLYDTNLHIPLLMRCPSLLPAGKRIGGLCQMPDIAPTILNLLDMEEIARREGMTGRSLVPLIESPVATTRGTTDALHITENTWMKKRGLRTATWKLIVPLETPDIHGRSEIELYDLTRDPGELDNVADARPDVTQNLRAQMEAHVARRVTETGLPDPLPVQPIPLRQIGKMETSVPDAGKQKAEGKEGRDSKLEAGDFIGYDRREEQINCVNAQNQNSSNGPRPSTP